MSGEIVGLALDRVIGAGARPRSITVDHGTEFQLRALEEWGYRQGVQFDFIRLGKPIENASLKCLTSGCETSVSTSTSSVRSMTLERSSKPGG